MNENRPLPRTAAAPGAAEVEDDEIDLLALAQLLWRGKWLIALAAILFTLAGGIYATQIATPIYPATAELALKAQEDRVMTDIESVLSGGGAGSERINTEIDVMTSRKLIGRLVDQLDLVDDPEFNETLRERPPWSPSALIAAIAGRAEPPPTAGEIRNDVIDAVREAIAVTNRRDSLTFEIKALSEDPAKSVRMANTLADIYVANQLREKYEANERASKFLSERAAELKQELEIAETRLSNFRERAELVSAEQLAGRSAQLKDLRDRIAALAATVAETRSRLGDLTALLDSGNYRELAAATGDIRLRRALEALEQGHGSEADVAGAAEAALATAQVQRNRQEAQLQSLKDSARRLEEEIDRQSAEKIQLQQLQRETEATRLLYQSFLSRLKETNIQRGLSQPDARMLSEAVKRPASSPRVMLILALSGVLGLMTGAGIVLVREALHTGIRTSEELAEATGRVVLGTIPGAPAQAGADVVRYLREKPTSVVAEAVRNLRTSVLLSNVDAPPRVIMTTSSVPGEGKTTLTLGMAQNMAAMGQRILLIEGDIRRRTFTEYFDTARATTLLAAMEDHALLDGDRLRDETIGADLLVGSKLRINAADLFSSRKFRDFIAAARARYDHVLIDTPPVLVVPDARVIGQEADAIVFAAKWDSTSRTQIRQALEMFRTVGLDVTGLVLTQIDARQMKRYGYGGQYGYDAGQSNYYDS